MDVYLSLSLYVCVCLMLCQDVVIYILVCMSVYEECAMRGEEKERENVCVCERNAHEMYTAWKERKT